MPVNFTVILFSRQRFGRNISSLTQVEPQAAFVGQAKDYSFDCPNVDTSQTAFMEFQAMGVSYPRNVFEINGVGVFGGLPIGPTRTEGNITTPAWTSHTLLVESHHQLRATGNVLHIESRDHPGPPPSLIPDDFILDNIIIVYKTR
ncbi:hypothetical protein ACVW1A_002899 [Bradyrhizobium sp. LB1.3]